MVQGHEKLEQVTQEYSEWDLPKEKNDCIKVCADDEVDTEEPVVNEDSLLAESNFVESSIDEPSGDDAPGEEEEASVEDALDEADITSLVTEIIPEEIIDDDTRGIDPELSGMVLTQRTFHDDEAFAVERLQMAACERAVNRSWRDKVLDWFRPART